MQTKRKTINFSIKRQLQIRLFIKILSISLIGVVLMAAVFYLYSNREINQSYRQFHIQADNFLEYLLPAVCLSLVLAVVSAVVITLFLPIKIAGPLYRIEQDLKEKVLSGDLTVKFRLRKGDEFGDLADTLNECITGIRQQIAEVKHAAEELDSIAGGLQEQDKIRKVAGTISDSLRRFKV